MAFACKLCIWKQQLWGERFRGPEQWFQSEEELLAHYRSCPSDEWPTNLTELPAWPGILEDAQACAEGYLICLHRVEQPVSLEFICYRCNARMTDVNDINWRRCLACGRTYRNFYSRSPWDRPSRSGL